MAGPVRPKESDDDASLAPCDPPLPLATATECWRWSLGSRARPAGLRSTLKLCEFEGFSSRKQDRKWQAGQHPSCGVLLHQPYPIPIPSPANFPSAPSPSELGFVQHQCVTATGGNAVAVGAESVVRGAQRTTPVPNRLRQLPKCCVCVYVHNGDLALACTPI